MNLLQRALYKSVEHCKVTVGCSMDNDNDHSRNEKYDVRKKILCQLNNSFHMAKCSFLCCGQC